MKTTPLLAVLGGKGILVWGMSGALGLGMLGILLHWLQSDEPSLTIMDTRARWVKVDHAVSGHSIKLKSDERLNYAGIRAPYPNEPFYEEAKQRNAELVDGKKARLRFDVSMRDRKGRLFAYVSVDNQLVNEMLVREGLAYVRLTPQTRRFADRLLAAQAEARKQKRGLWRRMKRSSEKSYPADPKYGNFHRPSCEEVARIRRKRLVTFKSKEQAFDAGLAPCSKCQP